MIAKYRIIVLAGCFILFGAGSVFSSYNFPPPEFDSNYIKPVMEKLPAGADWLSYLDIVVLLGAILLSAWASLKKRSRSVIVIISLFSLAYFGFYKEGCICPIGSIQNVAAALANPGYYLPVSVILIFSLPLIAALFFGRAYCGGACPHGALQDLLLIKEISLPKGLDRSLSVGAYLYLGLAVLFAVNDSGFLICRFDPFVPFFRHTGPFYMFVTGGVFILLSTFIGRPYCRFLCPYSALLKPLSLVSKNKVTITPKECIVCNLCAASCPYGAINEPAAKAPDQKRPRFFYIAFFIAALLLGSVLGYFTGGFLSRYDVNVKTALEIHNYYNTGTKSAVILSENAKEFIRKGESNEILFTLAGETVSHYKRSGIFLGAFILFVLFLQIVYSLRRPKREIYEPDSARCVSCGRCFRDCPIHRKAAQKENENKKS
ncbi:MAG: 4Fe-4S binding protein [Candidatus Firestonebacteria bacterium]|nr:4Fe-4S binding protein [Candidatus Firestonebacteria bacterium]